MPIFSPTLVGNRLPYNLPEPQKFDNNSWLQVSALNNFAAGIRSDNLLYAWGTNNVYQIGDGTTENKSLPVQISNSSFSLVSSGFDHSGAITTDNKLFVWGNQPSIQTLTVNLFWTNIDNGGNHFVALRNDGLLFTWGLNTWGQLGDNSTINKSSPVQIGNSSYASVSAGYYNSAALTSTGQLFAWGLNSSGQLGQGDGIWRSNPVQVTKAGVASWILVSAGNQYYLAIDNLNRLYGWGINNVYQLGLNDALDTASRNSPVQIGTSSWSVASAGGLGDHSSGIDINGNMYVWGNFNGAFVPIPTTIYSWSQLSAGGQHTSAIRSDNTLWTWGLNSSGQLGWRNTAFNRSSPVQVTSSSFTAVSSKYSHTGAITADTNLLTWGLNSSGQLGTGTTLNRSSPVVFSSIYDTSSYNQTVFEVNAGFSTSIVPIAGSVSGEFLGSDFLVMSSPAELSFGTGDFTVECWIYFSNLNTVVIWDFRPSATQGLYPCLYTTGSVFRYFVSSADRIVSTTPYVINTWYHVAIVKISSSTKMYQDGVQVGSTYADTNNYLVGNQRPTIGAAGQTLGNNGVVGYISNVRMVKGVGAYTANFTVPTTILTDTQSAGTNINAITSGQTSALLYTTLASSFLSSSFTSVVAGGSQTAVILSDGRLYTWGDNSAGQLGITSTISRSNAVQLGNTYVLLDTSIYVWALATGSATQNTSITPSLTGSPISIYLDGSNILYTPGNINITQVNANYSTSEGWFRFSDLGTQRGLFRLNRAGGTISQDGNAGVSLSRNTSNGFRVYSGQGSGDQTTVDVAAGSLPSANVWYHIAWTIYPYNCDIYVDGVRVVNGTVNFRWPFRWGPGSLGLDNNCDLLVGSDVQGVNFLGYVSNVRITKDNQVYTGASFTVPTAVLQTTQSSSTNISAITSDQVLLLAGTDSSSVAIVGSVSWSTVDSGDKFMIAKDPSGSLYGWGLNTSGQVGVGNIINRSNPTLTAAGSWLQVSTGFDHTLAIRSDNTLWTWGNFNAVSLVTEVQSWITISGGSQNSLAIKSDGTLWAWGANAQGQVGDATVTLKNSPVFIGAASWASVASGNSSSYAINDVGALYTWGWNSSGQLGLGNSLNRSSPTLVISSQSWSLIKPGFDHVEAIDTLGLLYSWGNYTTGQTGLEIYTTDSWVSIANGLALRADNTLWSWNNNVGDGTTVVRYSPVQIGSNDWLSIALSYDSSYAKAAIKTDYTLWMWGDNSNGQLGQNDTINRSSPVQVAGSWLQVSTQLSNTAAIDSSNVIYTWGNNSSGQLGDNTTINKSSPVTLAAPFNTSNWTLVSVGYSHMAAIRSDGALYLWGRNNIGQLGNNNPGVNRSNPILTTLTTSSFTIVSAGASHNIALRATDRALFGWGAPWGNGTTPSGNNISSPQQIGTSSWLTVAAGANSSYAINLNGSLWAWGSNDSGLIAQNINWANFNAASVPIQLGVATNWLRVMPAAAITSGNAAFVWGPQNSAFNNTGVIYSSLVQVGSKLPAQFYTPQQVGTSSWTTVESGSSFTVGIDNNNQLYGWGLNTSGQLADRTTVSRSSPVQLLSGSWIAIAAEFDHVLAIRNDTTLWTWGNSSAIGLITYPQSWSKISAGNSHTLAIRSDGALFTWGLNTSGQLGIGTVTDRSSPTLLGSNTGIYNTFIGTSSWSQISAGNNFSLAIDVNNRMFAWGVNSSFQLGDNFNVAKSLPVQIGYSIVDQSTYNNNFNRYGQILETSIVPFNNSISILSNPSLTWAIQTYYSSNTAIWYDDDFMMECWIFPLSFAVSATNSTPIVMAHGLPYAATTYWAFGVNTSGSVLFYYFNGTTNYVIGGGGGTLNSWQHIAMTHINSTGIIRLYHNGALVASVAKVGSPQSNPFYQVYIGSVQNTAFNGYVSNVRMVKGNVVYTGQFNPQTSPLTATQSAGANINAITVGQTSLLILTSPASAVSLSWSSVSAGADHVLATTADGKLYSWGNNNVGQAGRFNPTSSYTSVYAGADAITFISIRSDSTLWAWGYNAEGQLSTRDVLGRSSPVQVASGSWTYAAMGRTHGMAVRDDGTLWVWGNNDFGQLGISNTVAQASPVQVTTVAESWTQVTAGTYHSLGITVTGKLYAWGRNISGQLGDNSVINKSSPVQITSVAGSWSQIRTTGNIPAVTAGILSTGTMYTWGLNSSGQLGTGLTTDRSNPTLLASPFNTSSWTSVAVGGNYMMAILDNSAMYGWGNNDGGQLGNNTTINRSNPTLVIGSTSWTTLAVTNNSPAAVVTAAIATNGTLWTWGRNGSGWGTLGDGLGVSVSKSSPVQISSSSFTMIAGSDGSFIARRSDGLLFSWGLNTNGGQLGLNDALNRSSPTLVGNLPDLNRWSPVQVGNSSWNVVSAGTSFSSGIDSNSALYTWGLNSTYQLGDTTTVDKYSPIIIASGSWTTVNSGSLHSLSIRNDGALYGWGNSTALSINNVTPQSWSQIANGTNSSHNVAIQSDGTLWAWGLNTSGQLGDGTVIAKSSPVLIDSGSWTKVTSSLSNTYAVKADGTLWGWGDNSVGQLAQISNLINRSSPVLIDSGSWSHIAAGQNFALGIKNNSLFTWGLNSNGLLGLTNTINRSSITQVGTSSWSAIAAGQSFALAINNVGQLYAWGVNSSYQLGDNTTTNKSSPTQVGVNNILSWTTIAAGLDHSLALDINGKLWTWGNQNSISVDYHSWTQVATGMSYTLALRSDGALFAWGLNTSGQLGLGDVINRSSPVIVSSRSNYTQISAGNALSAAIDVNNNLFVWGRNGEGQDGLGLALGTNSVPAKIKVFPITINDGSSYNRATTINNGGDASRGPIPYNSVWVDSNSQPVPWPGATSAYSPGRNNLSIANTTELTLNSSQWTVEFWIYVRQWPGISTGNQDFHILGNTGSGDYWAFSAQNASPTPFYRWYTGTWTNVGVTTFGWDHLAAVRDNTTITVYLNGVATFTGGVVGTATNALIVFGNPGSAFTGGWGDFYISNIRIVKGISVYTSTFTPPRINLTSTQSANINGSPSAAISGTETSYLIFNNPASVTYTAASWTQVSVFDGPIAITTQGKLYAWSVNTQGQIGDGTTINKSTPVLIGNSSWTSVSAGLSYTLATDVNKNLFSWGLNNGFQLGDGTTTNRSSPVQVGQINPNSWNIISAGFSHAAAIDTTYKLYVWGPASQVTLITPTFSWIYLSASSSGHIMGLRNDYTLWGWGLNNAGQLGDNTTINKSSPVIVGGTSLWNNVRVGGSHTVAIKSDGTLWAWGLNSSGQIGNGLAPNRSSPVLVSSSSFTVISAGFNHTGAITGNNKLFMAGGNASGQIGDGTTTNRNPLVQIAGSWSLVSASTSFTTALDSTNLLFTWGLNSSGQLGIGLTTNRSSPVAVGALSWSSVDSEGNHVVALSTTNSLFVWGGNNTGQLGLGNTINRSSPVSVDSNSWSWVSAGDSFTVAIRSTGELYTWGLNSSGQLGLATTINRSSPVQVGTSSWTNVTAGTGIISAVRTDGLGFVWGLGTLGQIGNLLAISRSSPVQLNATPNVVSNYTVPTKIDDSSYTQVNAGQSTTTALRSDGTVWAWGLNTSGQLGNNTIITRSSPVQVGGTTSWAAIASGFANGAISSLNGVLFNWGVGNFGQLGSNTTINRSSPTQLNAGLATYAIPSNILGNQSFTAIAAGSSYSIGLRADNALMGWGINNSGQLGDSTLSSRSNPTLVGQPAYKDNSNYDLLVSSIGGVPKPVDLSPFASRPYNVATYGGSMEFNGINDIIRFGSNTMFDIGSNDASVEVWAYWNSFNTAVAYMTLFGQNSGATSTIRIASNLTSGVATVYYTYNDDNMLGVTPISAKTWYHLLVTVDTGAIRFFINGDLINYAPNATPVLTKNENYVFGNEDTGYFNGFMSNFRFINGSVPTTYQTAAKAGILDVSTYDARVTNIQSYVTFGTSIIPFAGATAGYFPGNVNGTPSVNSYLTLPNASQYQFGTGDFTVEFYIRKDSSYTAGTIITMNTAALGNWAVIMSAGTMFWQSSYTLTSLSPGISIATYLPIDTWVHVAIVRITGNTNIYINGTSRSNFADTTNYNGTGIITIGSAPTATYGTFEGYLSNIRVVKGVGVYTGNFTSPTSPLQATQSSGTNISAIAGTETSLLLFNDTSSAVSSVSVFSVPTTPLTTTSQGVTASDVALLCFQGSTTSYTNVNAQGTTSGFNNSSGQLYTVGLGTNGILGNGTATTRSKPVQLGTEFTGPNTRIISPSQLLSGSWVSVNAGVSTSTAIRNDNTLWAWGLNTSGQLGTTNATNQTLPKQTFNIIDSSTYNQTIYHIGTNYSEAVIPFAGAISGTFNGIDEYVYLTSPSQLIFGTSDFTIEFWVYAENYIFNGGNVTLIDWRSANGAFPAVIAGPSGLWYYVNTATRITGPVLLTNMWHHVAVCRQSSNTRMYLNGVQVGSTYADTTTYDIGTNRFIVGTDGVTSPGAVNNLKGYISNIRVVSGVAVYTGNFTVPSSPLTATQSSGVNISAITAGQTVFLSYTTPASIVNKNYIETSTENSTYYIEDTYSLYSTGLNNIGQLGITAGVTRSIPVQVGALGQTINTYTNSPVQVTPGTSGYAQIWAGQSFSAARRTNNDIFTWGLGTSGQLGLLDLISRSSPTLMSSTQSWNQVVSVGYSHWVTVRNVDFNFLDSSTYNFTITKNSPTTEYNTTVIPFATAVSVFQRANDFGQTISAKTAVSFGTGEFTIECWVYPLSVNSVYSGIFDARSGATGTPWCFGLRTVSSTARVDFFTGGALTGATVIPNNTWTHIAATRTGTTINIWVNGTLDTAFTSQSAALDPTNNNQLIGRLIDTPAYALVGYISNLRIVKGIAVYTGAFTVPTSPLNATQSSGVNIAAITGAETSLLTFRTEASSIVWQNNNKIYVQGGDGSGQLGTSGGGNRTSFVLVGNGTHLNSGTLSPVQVGFGLPNSWSLVSAGSSYSYAKNTLGQIYVWGNNVVGQLATGDLVSRSSPFLLGSTTSWFDVSQYSTSITTSGSLGTIGTAFGPFVGAASAQFNSGSLLTFPVDSRFNFNTANIEFWFYPTSYGGVVLRYGFAGNSEGEAAQLQWGTRGTFSLPSTSLGISGFNSPGGGFRAGFSCGSPALNTWTHISINLNVGCFHNGVLVSSGTNWNPWDTSISGYEPPKLFIGGPGVGFSGYISNFRFASVTIYTGTFTAPLFPLQLSGSATTGTNAFTSPNISTLLWNDSGSISGSVDINLLSTGQSHVAVTYPNNNLYLLGLNSSGQIGDNTTVNRTSFVLVGNYFNTNTISPVLAASASWNSVSSGTSYTLAIKSDSTLWAWGLNNAGQLGNNSTINRSSIVQVSANSFSFIRAGHSTSLAIDSDSRLFAWGLGTSGQLGYGTAANRSSPVQVGTSSWTSVATGNISSSGIDQDGLLYVWGGGGQGQFGTSTIINRSSPTIVQGINYETKSPTLVPNDWQSVSAGLSYTLGISGGLYGWGLNSSGQLGDSSTINKSTPVLINLGSFSVLDNSSEEATISKTGTYYSTTLIPFAGAVSGVFSNSTVNYLTVPDSTALSFGSGRFTIEFWTFLNSNPAVTAQDWIAKGNSAASGTWAIGYSNSNSAIIFKFGTTSTSFSTPLVSGQWLNIVIERGASYFVSVYINGVKDPTTDQISHNFNTTGPMYIGASRGAQSPRFNGYISNLRIINGTALYGSNFTPSTSPLTAISGTVFLTYVTPQLSILNSGTVFEKPIAGSAASYGIGTDGNMFAWGLNTVGQISGHQEVINKSAPSQIGANYINTNSSSPVQIAAGSWSQISAGNSVSAAIRSDGILFTWGSLAGSGQLGNNSTVARSSPIQIGTNSWTQISVYDTHMIGLQDTGEAYTWGLNASGQLGLTTLFAGGDIVNRSAPVVLGTPFSDVLDVSTYAHNITQTGTSFTTSIVPFAGTVTGVFRGGQTGLEIPASNAWALGDTCTMEFWIYQSVTSTFGHRIIVGNGIDVFTVSRDISIAGSTGTASTIAKTPLNTWVHVAIVINSGNLIIYFDGVSTPFTGPSTGYNYTSSTGILRIGRSTTVAYGWSGGYLSNLRIVKGVAVYTGTFTPPTSVLTVTQSAGTNISAITGTETSLLTYTTQAATIVGGTPTFWNSVAAGASFTGGVTADGNLFMWGLGTTGQLGYGTAANRSSPVQVGTSSWTLITAGSLNAAAIRNDGALFNWGLNTGFQLGNMWTSVNRSSPIQLGNTYAGQGTIYTRIPIQVNTLSWKSVNAGNSITSAISAQDRLFTWGLNTTGQIDQNTTISRSEPVQVGQNLYLQVSAGASNMGAVGKAT